MKLYCSAMTLDGVTLDGANPLPQFCDPIQDRALKHDGTFFPEDEHLFGFQTGKKVLPYLMQDRYTRNRSPQTIKTIVLENENLKAVFLPEYGARLYSLLNKKSGRELLYKNQMLQFGNLSQRNAWFSGGIEFNFGHYGHSALSCAPLFAAKINGPVYPFLRFYEYERTTGAFYRLDFHLPDGAKTLDMFVRMETAGDQDVPTYWWTNTAVRQTKRCRVFSGTDRILFDLPRQPGSPDDIPCFAGGRMPELKVVGEDISYPAQVDRACEIFFQGNKDEDLWEAAAYEDGHVFFETSTQPLRFRKIYCWGNHVGGRRWQRFLNAPQDSEYVEIQAGLAPTQLHGAILEAGKPIEFTQSFGECEDPGGCLELSWHAAAQAVGRAVRDQLPVETLYQRHEQYRVWAELPAGEFIHAGSGWGALECARLETEGIRCPNGLAFPAASLGTDQLPWLSLLKNQVLPMRGARRPAAWIVGDAWFKLLKASLDRPGGRHAESLLHLGVMAMEAGQTERAREFWEQSVALRPSAMAWRNLAQIHLRAGEFQQAITSMKQALSLPGAEDPAYSEEYLSLLVQDGQFQTAWDYFQTLAPSRCSSRSEITICKAALELGKDDFLKDFFAREHAVIREGEYVLTDAWFAWQARLLGEDEKELRLKMKLPEEIDFRMVTIW